MQHNPLVICVHKGIKKDVLYYGAIFLLLNLLCLSHLLELSTVSLGITIMILALCVVMPYGELGVYLYTCLPFFNVMNARVMNTSLFYVLCGVVILRVLLKRTIHYCIPQKVIILCTVFALTAFNLVDCDISFYVRWFIMVIVFVVMFRESVVTEKITGIIRKYSLGTVFASWWGYVFALNGIAINESVEKFYDGEWAYIRFGGLIGDSVVFGGVLLVLMAANFVLILQNKKKLFSWFVIANLFVLGCLTYSKTFFGGVIIELIMFAYLQLRHQKNKVRAFALTLVGVAAVTVSLTYWISYGEDDIAFYMRKRLSSADLTTGRTGIWEYYIDRWSEDLTILFKGIGFKEYAKRRVFPGIPRGAMYAHNIFIETVTAFGFIETAIIIIALCRGLFRFLKNHGDILLLFPAVILFVVFGMVTHGHFDSMYYFNVLLVLTIPVSLMKDTAHNRGRIEDGTE